MDPFRPDVLHPRPIRFAKVTHIGRAAAAVRLFASSPAALIIGVMSSVDILATLSRMDFLSYEPFHRALLATAGTLADLLEAIFMERMQIIKVSQETKPADATHAELELKPDDPVIERKVLVCGQVSQTCYVYAESLIAANHISEELRTDLLESDLPMNRLWMKHRLETFQEFRFVSSQPAGVAIARRFGCTEHATVLVRTYRVISGGRPIMTITEYFPTRFFPSIPVAPLG